MWEAKSSAEFLKAWIQKHHPDASLEALARKSRIKSKGALHDLLTGRRAGSFELTQKVARGLAIRGNEKKFFLLLWQSERNLDGLDVEAINLLRRRAKNQSSKLLSEQIPLGVGWDYVLAKIPADKPGIKHVELAKCIPFSSVRLKKILKDLKTAGLIDQDQGSDSQSYRALAAHHFFESDSFNEKEYLKEKVRGLKKSFDKNFGSRDETFYRNVVFTVSKSRYSELRKRLKILLDEFIDSSEDEAGDELLEVFLAFQKYPTSNGDC